MIAVDKVTTSSLDNQWQSSPDNHAVQNFSKKVSFSKAEIKQLDSGIFIGSGYFS